MPDARFRQHQGLLLFGETIKWAAVELIEDEILDCFILDSNASAPAMLDM